MEEVMRKVLDVIGWFLVTLSVVVLLGTLMTAYQIRNIKYFRTYSPVEICIFATMIFWGFRMMDKKINRKAIFPVLCIGIALISLFFFFMKVN